jgi:hypothetical protein
MRQEKVAWIRIDVERVLFESEELLIHSTVPHLLPSNRDSRN